MEDKKKFNTIEDKNLNSSVSSSNLTGIKDWYKIYKEKIQSGELNLSANNIGNEESKLDAVIRLIKENIIIKLDLSDNELGQRIDTIFNALRDNNVLTEIIVSRNKIKSFSYRNLMVLQKTYSLCHVNLSGNEISEILESNSILERDIDRDYYGIRTCIIDLSKNKLNDKSIDHLCTWISKTRLKLIYLNLSNNELTDEAANFFADLLSKNDLPHINLSHNKISENGILLIANALQSRYLAIYESKFRRLHQAHEEQNLFSFKDYVSLHCKVDFGDVIVSKSIGKKILKLFNNYIYFADTSGQNSHPTHSNFANNGIISIKKRTFNQKKSISKHPDNKSLYCMISLLFKVDTDNFLQEGLNLLFTESPEISLEKERRTEIDRIIYRAFRDIEDNASLQPTTSEQIDNNKKIAKKTSDESEDENSSDSQLVTRRKISFVNSLSNIKEHEIKILKSSKDQSTSGDIQQRKNYWKEKDIESEKIIKIEIENKNKLILERKSEKENILKIIDSSSDETQAKFKQEIQRIDAELINLKNEVEQLKQYQSVIDHNKTERIEFFSNAPEELHYFYLILLEQLSAFYIGLLSANSGLLKRRDSWKDVLSKAGIKIFELVGIALILGLTSGVAAIALPAVIGGITYLSEEVILDRLREKKKKKEFARALKLYEPGLFIGDATNHFMAYSVTTAYIEQVFRCANKDQISLLATTWIEAFKYLMCKNKNLSEIGNIIPLKHIKNKHIIIRSYYENAQLSLDKSGKDKTYKVNIPKVFQKVGVAYLSKDTNNNRYYFKYFVVISSTSSEYITDDLSYGYMHFITFKEAFEYMKFSKLNWVENDFPNLMFNEKDIVNILAPRIATIYEKNEEETDAKEETNSQKSSNSNFAPTELVRTIRNLEKLYKELKKDYDELSVQYYNLHNLINTDNTNVIVPKSLNFGQQKEKPLQDDSIDVQKQTESLSVEDVSKIISIQQAQLKKPESKTNPLIIQNTSWNNIPIYKPEIVNRISFFCDAKNKNTLLALNKSWNRVLKDSDAFQSIQEKNTP